MKRPAYQWYPGDFRRDMGLQSCSWEARALWRDLLDIMHDGQPYGHLAVNNNQLALESVAKMIGLPLPRVKRYLGELERAGVSSRAESGALFSRRMVKDEETRLRRAAGGELSKTNPNVPRKKGYPPARPSPHPSAGPPKRPPKGPSGGPLQLQSASASATAEEPLAPNGAGKPPGGWPAEYAELFAPIGSFAPPRIGKALKPVRERYGPERTREMLAVFVQLAPHQKANGEFDPATQAHQFCTPERFAQTAGFWYKQTEPLGHAPP